MYSANPFYRGITAAAIDDDVIIAAVDCYSANSFYRCIDILPIHSTEVLLLPQSMMMLSLLLSIVTLLLQSMMLLRQSTMVLSVQNCYEVIDYSQLQF